jgi:hypothetical protein
MRLKGDDSAKKTSFPRRGYNSPYQFLVPEMNAIKNPNGQDSIFYRMKF